MNRILPLLLIMLCTHPCLAQKNHNYILNGNFEDMAKCPSSGMPQEFTHAYGWRNFNQGGTGYYNSCFPSYYKRQAASGNGYFGLVTWSTVKDTVPYWNWGGYALYSYPARYTYIEPGKQYSVSMYVSHAGGRAANTLGVYFFNDIYKVGGIHALDYKAQVSFAEYGPITDTGWTRIEGFFTPDTIYTNIVLGSFLDINSVKTIKISADTNYAYYYVDSLVVTLCQKLFDVRPLTTDTVFCTGRQLDIGCYIKDKCPLDSGNVFTAQLYKANPPYLPITRDLGTVTNIISDTINTAIPNDLLPGDYRFRLISTKPDDTIYSSRSYKIYPQPRPIAKNSGPGCDGEMLQISVGDLSFGVQSYTWTGPNGFTLSGIDTLISAATPALNGVYIVHAVSGTCTASDSTTVLIRPNPAKGKILSNTPVCEGDELKIYFADNNPDIKYTWRGPNNFGSDNKDLSFKNANDSLAGIYKVFINHFNCETQDNISVVVKPVHIPEAYSNSPLIAGQQLVLGVGNTKDGVNYLWTGPNGFQTPGSDPLPIKTNEHSGGDYIVTGTLNGCSRSDTINIEVMIPEDTGRIILYPNPANNRVVIMGRLINDQRVSMKIADAAGHTVYEDFAETKNKLLDKQIALPPVSAGNYYLQLNIDGQTRTIPFIIIH